jgi:pimeloyl-ACP methyl ester carboxylesterase
MVPGLDGTALLFYRQIPRLAPLFRVVSFPLPDDATCTMDSLVADLDEVIEQVSPDEPVLLCGESFGGALSLSFALAHPERLRGLIILNSFPRVRQRIQIRLGPPLLKLMPWGAMPLVRRFTESKMHTSHTSPEDLQEFHERSRAIGRTGYIRRLEILKTYDIRERLEEIATPTLFLAADQDHLVASAKDARFMASRMPNATVEVLEGFGHICLINHDFDLRSKIEPWLDRCVFDATPSSAHPPERDA